MAKRQQVYVTPRTFSALRGNEVLSVRINQLVDRWLEVVRAMSPQVRQQFTPDEWRILADGLDATYEVNRNVAASDMRATIARGASERDAPALAQRVLAMSDCEACVLAELLELQVIGASAWIAD